jgi:hypothetical protein
VIVVNMFLLRLRLPTGDPRQAIGVER